MAGHSHWSNIQVKKGVADKKRAKLFSKLSRYIIIAARAGGGDPITNLKLRYAIDKARSVSMPRDNIERAIKRGTGDSDTDIMEELTYEGYGPGGAAIFCDILTDNRNRSSGEVRKLFEKGGGNMGAPGCVGYLFDRLGVLTLDQSTVGEDALMELILEAGAEDLKTEEGQYVITCEPTIFANVQHALDIAHLKSSSAEVVMLPKALVDVDLEVGQKIIRLLEHLDDHEDVQNVYCNAKLTAEMATE